MKKENNPFVGITTSNKPLMDYPLGLKRKK